MGGFSWQASDVSSIAQFLTVQGCGVWAVAPCAFRAGAAHLQAMGCGILRASGPQGGIG